jgi:hypothetical protein
MERLGRLPCLRAIKSHDPADRGRVPFALLHRLHRQQTSREEQDRCPLSFWFEVDAE